MQKNWRVWDEKKNSKLSGFILDDFCTDVSANRGGYRIFFNESKLPVRFTGFSLKWYQELIHDRQ